MKDKFIQWLKNPQVYGFFISVVVMALVSIAFFAPNNFNGDVLAQHDMQQGAANGEEGRAYEELTGEKALWTNSLFGGMPTFQISPEYPSNHLFTWINSVYGLGLPTPSNLLFMMMLGMLIMCYCARMRWWYALIAALAWGLSSYFVIIIGAGHIWKFLALTYVPPTIGAMLVAYRGRYIAGSAILAVFTMMELNANHPQITYYSLFIMVALAVAYLIGALVKKRIGTWCKGSLALLVGGLLGLGANLPSLYNTYEYAKQTKRAQSELAQAPSADAPATERPTGGLPKAEIGGWSNTPGESLSLLVPNIKGGASIKPTQGRNAFLSLSELDQYKTSAPDDPFGIIPQFGQYFGGKGMTNGPFYLGALVCALFLLGCIIVRGPAKWALLVATIFSVMLAMGNHFEALTDFMIYNFPMYNKFRAAETALVIAALCVPFLALLGLQKLFSTPDALRRYRVALGISFGLPILITLALAIWPDLLGQPFSAEEIETFADWQAQMGGDPFSLDTLNNTLENIARLRLDMVSADAMRSLFILVLGAVVVIIGCRSKRLVPVAVAGVGLIVLCDMYNVDKRYIDTDSFISGGETAVNPLAPDAADTQILADKDYYRVADLVNFGDARRSYYHHMVGGYHAAKLNRFNDIIDHRLVAARAVHDYVPEVRDDSLVALAPEGQADLMRRLRADYRVLDMLNTRYIITSHGVAVNDRALGPAWLVGNVRYVDGARAEMDALASLEPAKQAVADRQFQTALGNEAPTLVPGDTITLVKYTPNTLTYDVTTRNGGVAVFSEVYFPWGWHATIEGEGKTEQLPLARVNYILRAARIPAGKYRLTMTFDPQSLHVTGALAYASVSLIYLLVLGAVFAPILRSRKKN